MTKPRLQYSHVDEGGNIVTRDVCLETENTTKLSREFPIRRVMVHRYELPNTLETIEYEDLAARMLGYAKAAGKIIAVRYHDFIHDIYDEMNENFSAEKRISRIPDEEDTVGTQIKSALRHIFFGRPSLRPLPQDEIEHETSALIALARVNPSVIQAEVAAMIRIGYFMKREIHKTLYLEPTEKLLERVFRAQEK